MNAEKLIKDSEAYKAIFKYSSNYVGLVSKTAKILDVNDNLLEAFGYLREELIGKSFVKLIDISFLPTVLKNLAKIFTVKYKGIGTEMKIKTKANGFVYLKTSGNSIKVYNKSQKTIGALILLTDITGIKENEEKYRLLFENMHDGCAVYEVIDNGENFIFKDFNKASEKIDEINKEKVLGKKLTKIFPRVKEFGLFEVLQRVWKTGKSEYVDDSFYKDDRIQTWRKNYVYKLPSSEIVAIYEDITKRKESELKLKSKNEEYASLNQEFLIINEDLRILTDELTEANRHLNKNDKQLEKAQEVALLGHYELNIKSGYWTSSKVLDSIFGINSRYTKNVESWLQIIHPGFKKEMADYLNINILKKHGLFDKEYKIINQKTKEERWVHGLGELICNKKNELITMFGTIQDITKQKETELILKQSEDKYRMLFENMLDGFAFHKIVTDDNKKARDYIFLEVNKAFETQTGLNRDEIINKRVTEVLPGIENDPADWIGVYGKVALSGKSERFESFAKNLQKWYSVLAFSPKKEYFATVFNDITNQKESELKLIKQNKEYASLNEEYLTINEELLKAKNKAEESDNLKTAFLANLSHEIRTPMNGIIGFSRLLEKEDLTFTKTKLYLDLIKTNSKQLLGIINNLVDISKIETGQTEPVEMATNINNIITDLFVIYETQAKKKNIVLKVEKSLSDQDAIIYTDFIKLRQIIENILFNALKFTHEGYIEFGYKLQKNKLLFFVEDTGIGISDEFHKTIFERFRQADNSSTREYGGTGLGLAISKSYVELLGGSIKVKSQLGKGSVFSFTIPYNKVKDKNTENDNILHVSNINKGKIILVVEDNISNYIYLEELLSEIDAQIIHAKNGYEAIKFCKENPKINMVLLDIKLPDMSGYEVLKTIRTFRKELPIIAQTAFTMSGDKEKALSEGCNDYIAKPINQEHLFRIIDKY